MEFRNKSVLKEKFKPDGLSFVTKVEDLCSDLSNPYPRPVHLSGV